MRRAAFGLRAAHARICCAKAGVTTLYGWASCVSNGCRCRREMENEGYFDREACPLIGVRPRGNEQSLSALVFELGVSAPVEFFDPPDAICKGRPAVDGRGNL